MDDIEEGTFKKEKMKDEHFVVARTRKCTRMWLGRGNGVARTPPLFGGMQTLHKFISSLANVKYLHLITVILFGFIVIKKYDFQNNTAIKSQMFAPPPLL